jgi:hypothetical protein
MTTDATLSPELDPGPPTWGARVRALLAVPGRLLGALLIPDRVMPAVVARQRSGAPLLVLVLCGLTASAVIGLRVDTTASVLNDEIQMQKHMGPDFEPRSDRELNEEINKQTTVEQVKLGLSAGLLTPLLVFTLGLAVLFAGRYVGGKTTFGGAMAAASHASLPMAVKSLVVAAMAWPSRVLTPGDVDALRHVAVIGPPGSSPLHFFSVDAFLLWSVFLLVFGLAAAGQMTRRRSFLTVVFCFAIFQLWTGGASGAAGGPGPGPHMMPPGGHQ